jgi:hypothetical protein
MNEKLLAEAMAKYPAPPYKTTTQEKTERTLKILEEYRSLRDSGQSKPEEEAA